MYVLCFLFLLFFGMEQETAAEFQSNQSFSPKAYSYSQIYRKTPARPLPSAKASLHFPSARASVSNAHTSSFGQVPLHEKEAESPPIVWFVHGMLLIHRDFSSELESLKKLFPNAESVQCKVWDAPKGFDLTLEIHWNKSVASADEFTPELVEKIEALSPEERDRLVLVGHSLGCRIVVKALSEIYRRHRMQIRQCLLAGAALDFHDPDIAEAAFASRLTMYNLINPDDVMLKAYRIADKQTALGTGCLYPMNPDEFFEISLTDTSKHDAAEYFSHLLKCIESDDFRSPKVIVPQVLAPAHLPSVGSWKTLDSLLGWKLQQNSVSNLCRILNEKNDKFAVGKKEEVTAAFARVRQQLVERAALPIPRDGVVLPVRKPVTNYGTLGSGGWWIDLRNTNGWRLQKNRTTGRYRILDPQNLRRAAGSQSEMELVFGKMQASFR